MNGYTGKILRVDLSTRKISIIPTKDYEQWGGGHGIGSAIFWDLVKDKAISGFDPKNVITIMTSPLSGTLAPAASSRTEVQGIGVQSSPIEWFTRSNFGGRFAAILKFAGWDGIVIEGKSDKPVWIDIRDKGVEISDADGLWGLDALETQNEIWEKVTGTPISKDWMQIGSTEDGPRTTQLPAVLAIGPAGENMSRTGCLVHDAGHASGQGGFGGVWGSKNLKAISVIGTGSVNIADSNALLQARQWVQKKYGLDLKQRMASWWSWYGRSEPWNLFWDRRKNARLKACIGCPLGCMEITKSGLGSESTCVSTSFYSDADRMKHNGRQTEAVYLAADYLQKYGINAYEALKGLYYIRDLYKKGALGPGKKIDCDLDFSQFGTTEFVKKFLKMIACREGAGDDFAEGFYRAAQRWGRQEKDLKTGLLEYPYWGLPEHSYDPRAEVEWGYGSILGDRDINEHDFNALFWWPTVMKQRGMVPQPPAEEVTKIFTDKMVPYDGDPLMLDYSTENIYSEHIVKLVAWHRYYTRFWKQSVLYCDQRWPDFINTKAPGFKGLIGEGEPKFFNAVTGKNFSFLDGIELGKKIWNLDNAIWVLQGRHRDMVHFADYIYTKPFGGDGAYAMYHLPGRKNGKWDYIRVNGRHLDKSKFEDWKSKYYLFEGWDPNTGWPTQKTLESLGLKQVANELKKHGKLGKGKT